MVEEQITGSGRLEGSFSENRHCENSGWSQKLIFGVCVDFWTIKILLDFFSGNREISLSLLYTSTKILSFGFRVKLWDFFLALI